VARVKRRNSHFRIWPTSGDASLFVAGSTGVAIVATVAAAKAGAVRLVGVAVAVLLKASDGGKNGSVGGMSKKGREERVRHADDKSNVFQNKAIGDSLFAN